MALKNWPWSLVFAAGVLLAGCSSGGGSEPAPTTGGGAPAPTASNVPQAPTGEGEITGELKVAAFKGGYDVDFFDATGKDLAKAHEGVNFSLVGDPRIWEQLRPQFAAGDVPDLVFPGWGMDHWALVGEGQILALDDALKSKPAEGEGTWADTFDPNLLKLCQQDGHTYMLPYYVMTYGWWYDENVFKANGWTPPTTWDELLALCEKIKAKGMEPITFQGKYPYYMVEGMLLPWSYSHGGADVARSMQNLDPGAWKSESALKGATMIDELNKKGYLAKGAVGLTHTEAQMDLLLGKAAMAPCGSWIESEMGKQLDEIAKSGKPRPKLRFFLPPHLADGKGDGKNILIGVEPWMVPAKAKNPNAAVALYKQMTALSVAKKFVTQKGTLMSIKGSDETDMPEGLKASAAALKSATFVWANQYRSWYPAFEKEIEDALTALLTGSETPQSFCDRIEKKAEETRNDDEIKKHKVAF